MTGMSERGPVPEAPVAHSPAGTGHGAFDGHHPPSRRRVEECVHCGFCLPACPTYGLWGEEMDSPRGRILLMKEALEGHIALDDVFVRHMDACLGCMACMSACPSGVRYDELIEATRAQIERLHRRGPLERAYREALFAVFPHPGRVRVAAVAAWAYQRSGLAGALHARRWPDRLPGRMGRWREALRALDGLMPPVSLGAVARPLPRQVGPHGAPRRRVGLVAGCIQRGFFAQVNWATVRVLVAEGCEVVVPRPQGCCGALMVHAGREASALRSARALVDAFEGWELDDVVVNAAGCGSTLKDYGRLLADDPGYAGRASGLAGKARDVTEVLAGLEPRARRHPVRARVAYHDACHLSHAQGVRSQPRQVLASVPGLEVVELGDDQCCGSAGIYNLVQPEAGEELGRHKADLVRAAGVEAVVTANPGCNLQLRRFLGPGVPVFHPVEVLDASLRGRPSLAGAQGV